MAIICSGVGGFFLLVLETLTIESEPGVLWKILSWNVGVSTWYYQDNTMASDKLSVICLVFTDNPPREEIGSLRGMFFCCSLHCWFLLLLIFSGVGFRWLGLLQNTRQRSVDGGSSPGGAWVVAPGGQIVATLLCKHQQTVVCTASGGTS